MKTVENPKSAYLDQFQHEAKLKFGSIPYEIFLNNEYPDVIFRLGQVLPMSVVLDWFSSQPNATGGKARFPYQRIDTTLLVISKNIDLMKTDKIEKDQMRHYEQASLSMAKTLAWIHIGWQGLDNFAHNPQATINWTSGPGHFATDDERAIYITTKGKEWVDKVVTKYIATRKIYDPKVGENDVFRKYKIEYLLTK